MLPTRRIVNSPFSVLREVDRALNNVWSEFEGDSGSATGTFPVDIREVDDKLVVEADLPGFTKDQIDISVEQGVLSIEANRQSEKTEPDKGQAHVIERRYHHLARRFTLPSAYNTDEVDAHYDNGVLTVTLPKREEVKPRKIQVK